MIKICYKCGQEEEVDKEFHYEKPFICSNEKCDSWQHFYVKDRNSLAIKDGWGKLVCKKCDCKEKFIPCGDGDGIRFIMDQWKCPGCGQTVWVYSQFDTPEIIELKANRANIPVSFQVIEEKSRYSDTVYYDIETHKHKNITEKYKSILSNDKEFATLKEAEDYIDKVNKKEKK